MRRGRRTKHLVKRLRPGEIAVINHRNLDRVSAEDLIACGAAAVLNCNASAAADYPNMGPVLLVEAGIPLIELPDDAIFDAVRDGDRVEISGGEVRSGGRLIAVGVVQEPADVLAANEQRRRDIGGALVAFARNTVQHMVEEQDLLSGKIDLPRFDTDFRDRPVLIVVRGVDHQADLQALRPYVRDVRPVLLAVDGGADAILQAGFRPDMIVGDMDSASEAALRCGAELVVHAYADGRAPGRELLERLGLEHKVIPAPGTSQDIAMLIAGEKGAELIVSVGSQFNLVEFLDKNRRGMSSTFLTRLRLGERIVDAKGVSRLYRPSPGLAPVVFVLVAGVLVLVAVILATPALREVVDLLWLKLRVLLGGAP
ncbi:unannotated protein [freshwater metagenome]|uniref:Unannotated protein n=1 Tax=freshwater metagenome TaxID=449393 RepID=A0A6J7EC56_9ZZZZ